jgi:excinuclease ABC subunit C
MVYSLTHEGAGGAQPVKRTATNNPPSGRPPIALASYPGAPGCYLMKDSRGRVLYVGKAKNLRRRLASYFRPGRERWLGSLLKRLAEIEVVLVHNETESLLLEHNLIKLHRPRYNRQLKSDRTGYSYIALTDEPLPRFVPYRKHRPNQALERIGEAAVARRFGPYVSVRFRNHLLDYVNDHYGLRSCDFLPRQPCLRYHMHRCDGVCAGVISADEYRAAIARAAAFLAHPPLSLTQRLRRQMMAYAAAQEFERAAWLKRRLEALEQALQPQVVERQVAYDQDVIYCGEAHAFVGRVRRGTLYAFGLHPLSLAPADWLLARYARHSPPELILNRLDEPDAIGRALSASNGYRVRLTLPRRGDKATLLSLCELNYHYRLESNG